MSDACNIFVAGFIGTPQMNFINGVLNKKDDGLYFDFEGVSVKIPGDKADAPELADYIGQEVVLGIRPEGINDDANVVAANAETKTVLDVDVDVVELMGAEIYLYLNIGETNLIARVSARSTSRGGDKIKVAFDMSRVHIFDKDTERCVMHL